MKDIRYYSRRAKIYDIFFWWWVKRTSSEIKFFQWIFSKYSRKVRTILDIACGNGRFSIPLAKLGYKVTGIDLTKELIEEAKNRTKTKKVNIDFRIEDMTKFKFNKKFDAILVGFDSILEVKTKAEILKTLKNFYYHLNKNGVLIFDVDNFDSPKGIMSEKSFFKYKIKGYSVIHKYKSWVKGNLLRWKDMGIIKKGKKKIQLVDYKEYPMIKYNEWIRMLNQSGFRNIKIFEKPTDRKEYKGSNPSYFYFVVKKI